MLIKLLVFTSALLIASCASIEPSKSCLQNGINLIQDPDFSLEANNHLSRSWGQSQHAGEPSFETDIKNGVLTISRTGSQPWFSYRQVLQPGIYAGQKMVFSADIKLDLTPPAIPHGFGDGGGLSIMAKSSNGKLLLRSVLEHEPHIGKTDWQTVQVVVELPSVTRWVTLAFLHQADGIIEVRNPFFGPVTNDTGNCAATKEI